MIRIYSTAPFARRAKPIKIYSAAVSEMCSDTRAQLPRLPLFYASVASQLAHHTVELAFEGQRV